MYSVSETSTDNTNVENSDIWERILNNESEGFKNMKSAFKYIGADDKTNNNSVKHVAFDDGQNDQNKGEQVFLPTPMDLGVVIDMIKENEILYMKYAIKNLKIKELVQNIADLAKDYAEKRMEQTKAELEKFENALKGCTDNNEADKLKKQIRIKKTDYQITGQTLDKINQGKNIYGFPDYDEFMEKCGKCSQEELERKYIERILKNGWEFFESFGIEVQTNQPVRQLVKPESLAPVNPVRAMIKTQKKESRRKTNAKYETENGNSELPPIHPKK